MGFKTTRVSRLPMCDFCSDQGVSKEAQYDGKTMHGPWANMCYGHYKRYGIGVGLGKGQKYIVQKLEHLM